MEKEFFMNLLNESKITSPKRIEIALHEKFDSPVNIDWYLRDEFYEAVFYSNNIEHIAKYDLLGKLIHFKINLSIDEVPDQVKGRVVSRGEIMSAVEINRETDKLYELILQDKFMKRSLVLLDMNGKVMDDKAL